MCGKDIRDFCVNPESLVDRELSLSFFIDSNRINARQNIHNMNQLEKWNYDRVILINSPIAVTNEILNEKSNSPSSKERKRKIKEYVFSMPCAKTKEDKEKYMQIENILFPETELNSNQKNDVDIVYNCLKVHNILITNDGDSKKQPKGILGNKCELKNLGITVMNDTEAVELVKIEIVKRDDRIKELYEKKRIEELPEWVGKD